jgi:hypothetical protein
LVPLLLLLLVVVVVVVLLLLLLVLGLPGPLVLLPVLLLASFLAAARCRAAAPAPMAPHRNPSNWRQGWVWYGREGERTRCSRRTGVNVSLCTPIAMALLHCVH